MSEATSLLADLIVARIAIRADGADLVGEATPDVVTVLSPKLKAALTRNKAELLLMLEQERGVSWAEWQAAMLNRLFLKQGTSGRPGRFTAAIVEHRENQRKRNTGTKVDVNLAGVVRRQ